MRSLRPAIPLLAALLLFGPLSAVCGAVDVESVRAAAAKSWKGENTKEAYERYRKLILDPDADPRQVPVYYEGARVCLEPLNRLNELDEFREGVVQAHTRNWRALKAVADSYLSQAHYGFIIAGEFRRGQHRGGGRWANATERDRVRALQLLQDCLPFVEAEGDPEARSGFYLGFADAFMSGRGHREAWRLQVLTDLGSLPDYDEGRGHFGGGQATGAPVDAEGNPVFHRLPKSFEAAETDGERWRWLLMQAMESDANRVSEVKYVFATFLHEQFGVQTMASYGRLLAQKAAGAEDDAPAGPFAVHTLGEDETIARLASGVKRFSLPPESNYIRILRDLAGTPRASTRWNAARTLAEVFENRRQYDKAVEFWEKHGAPGGAAREEADKRIAQITGNWGTFESATTQAAGTPATVDYRFRNGREVRFEAFRVDLKRLLDDAKAHIEAKPTRVDRWIVNLDQIGHRLIQEDQTGYIGAKAAEWTLALAPRPNHFDRRVTVTTPLKESGAYLLVATMKGGNSNRIIVWLEDTVIVRKALDGDVLYFVADAVTGAPIPKADVELFGWRQEHIRGTKNFRMHTSSLTRQTDETGQLVLGQPQLPPQSQFQWLAVATTAEGRLAFHGFRRFGLRGLGKEVARQTKVLVITDRPVYRPGQTVKFKAWVRCVDYESDDTSELAGQSFPVVIRNRRGDKVFSKPLRADAYGGVQGGLALPDDAALGPYSIQVQGPHRGAGSFRVEEYRKPEFEVTVEAPGEPVMLGESVKARVKATYYFGGAVAKGVVKIKVLRHTHDARWYPPMPWDWLYGSGYWWFGRDYDWYPGWSEWGCLRPVPPWRGRGRWVPPEIVAEYEVPVGEDGVTEVTIDTSLAKELHGDLDHRYEVTAEVRDESRRTVVGSGEVLVARKPFSVYAWADRGHYVVGEPVHVACQAHTLDRKPVQGTGELRLLRITYDHERRPVETQVQSWKLSADEQGRTSQRLTASRAGQYRLSYRLTDGAGHTIEGGQVFTVRGDGIDDRAFRFDQLELVPDAGEYAPGDTVRLQVGTDRVGSTVLLFVRPFQGVYPRPQVLRLEGKSVVTPVAISRGDMPNIYIEALTVSGGRVYEELREIVVPPEKRILNVEVEPSASRYKPGEKGSATVKLTDLKGKPFVGSTVVTLYDKSVEYISGGSNVPEIKAFFWKWRRQHHIRTESNLGRWFQALLKRGEVRMQDLGVFGHLAADEAGDDGLAGAGAVERGRPRMMLSRSAPSEAKMAFSAAPMAAMVADAGAAMEGMAMGGAGGGGAAPDAVVEPTVRTEFADTALWIASLGTDADGCATIDLPMPENPTTWKLKVWAMGHGTKVGEGSTEVITSKDLLLRMQGPRFFVQKDEVVLSANVHNYLDKDKRVSVVLELDGPCLQAMEGGQHTFVIKREDEARVDWRVRVVEEGEAVVRMKALTDEESDAMEMRFPVYVHGMEKLIPRCGVIRPEEKALTFTFRVPEERRPDSARLEVRYSPTLAMAMVDALPYLVGYPYGCTEQTLNRFLPTVITQGVLQRMGVSLSAIREKRTNLNAQQLAGAGVRAEQMAKRYGVEPVFDEAAVARMAREGLDSLVKMQLTDGGWGWFSGYGERSSAHTTALVVHGLLVARENDTAVPGEVLGTGVAWLQRHQAEQVERIRNGQLDPPVRPWKPKADNRDALVYAVLAEAAKQDEDMRGFLYRDRGDLSVHTKALFALALHRQGHADEVAMLKRNIGQFLVQDDENQTAYLRLGNGGYWWFWYGDEIEAHAQYLKLLALTEPRSEVAPRLVKYLLNNRQHAIYWKSTRDTAVCVEAFAHYLKASGEDEPDMRVAVAYDGKEWQSVRITRDNLFSFSSDFVLSGDAIGTGEHRVEIRRTGRGALYANGYLSLFTLEDPIAAAGLEIKVRRRFFRLTEADGGAKAAGSHGQVVDQRTEKYVREELSNDAELKSGELVEIELVIESKNDYEYVVLEDMKAAGFEPVEVRSGYGGNGLGAYMELRDEKVCFFVRQLARGRHSVSYRLRAETPGRFSALPARAYAMYAPELRANSNETKLRVAD